MAELMMSVSGIRGVIGAALTPDRVARFAAAFGTHVGDGRVVIGRDSRPSGAMIAEAAAAGLRASGRDVVQVGIVPTPTIQICVEALGAAGGIAVTASHNPSEWNALKFISHRGTFLGKPAAEALFALEREDRIEWADHGHLGGESTFGGAVDAHVERVLALSVVDRALIGKTRPKVVVDALHGAAGPITRTLLQALGCDADILYEEPTGRFPRNPEPLPEHIGELGEAVRERGADIGFALDPDGDRLAIVDERGEPIGEDVTLPLCMAQVLSTRPGVVVTNFSTSLLVDAVAERHGARVRRAPVGEANVVARMVEVDAVIGGEGNGGVIYPDAHLGRDAPVAMALVLSLLAAAKRPISAIVGEFPRYEMRKDKIELSGASGADGFDRVVDRFGDAEVDRTDGVYLRWPDGFLHVRKSGTEPIVRVIAGGLDRQRVNERVELCRELLSARSVGN